MKEKSLLLLVVLLLLLLLLLFLFTKDFLGEVFGDLFSPHALPSSPSPLPPAATASALGLLP
jgi:hypothetical protein